MTRNTRVVTCCLLTLIGVGCTGGDTTATTGSEPAPAPAAPAATQAPTSTSTAAQQPAAPAAAAAQPVTTATQPVASAQPPAAASGSAAAAGSPAVAPVDPAQPGAAPAAPTAGATSQAGVPPEQIDHNKDIRGTCVGLKTAFPDDNACIVAPRPEEGFQIHVGPSNYDDPAEVAKFVIKPGEEKTECWTFRTTNEQELTYQTALLSGRAGTHHIINTTWSGELPQGEFTQGCGVGAINPLDENAPAQIGSLPGASKAYMERRTVAPEFADVGRKIPAKSLVTSDMHYYNFTDKDILREYWINVYFPPKEQVIERYATDIAAFGGFAWNVEPIQPGTDMVYKYECPITGDGFIMNLLGHYHIHGKRFGVSIKRMNGMSEKVFEMYDPADPAVFDYNTVTMNPAFTDLAAGATSGVLPVKTGDTLQWECHIINDSNNPLAYTNEVKTGEMCNTWGYSVGIEPLQCGVP
jgi:hypothetical protein